MEINSSNLKTSVCFICKSMDLGTNPAIVIITIRTAWVLYCLRMNLNSSEYYLHLQLFCVKDGYRMMISK
jgi:hypothetical protein